MAIQFACQCGKTLKAAVEHASRRAKCGAMLLAGAWFAFVFNAGSIRAARSFAYMGIIFLGGAISFINGLCDGDDAQ